MVRKPQRKQWQNDFRLSMMLQEARCATLRYDNRTTPTTIESQRQHFNLEIWCGSMDAFGAPNVQAASWRINTTGHIGLFKPLEHTHMNWTFRKPSENIEFFRYRSYISQLTTPSRAKFPPHLHLLSSMKRRNGKLKRS
jgi:hypothetical protein